MKINQPKIILVIFSLLMIFPGVSLGAANYFPYDLEVPIGSTTTINALSEYIEVVYRFFISIIGIIATVMIMYGGIKWITAAGNETRISSARETITSAVIGLVLALCSYLILFTINQDLVELRAVDLTEIEPKSECSDDELHKIAVASACKKDCECAQVFADPNGKEKYSICKYDKCQLGNGGMCGWLKINGETGKEIDRESRTDACQDKYTCLNTSGESEVKTSGENTFMIIYWYCLESKGRNTASVHKVDGKEGACEFPMSYWTIDGGECWSDYPKLMSQMPD